MDTQTAELYHTLLTNIAAYHPSTDVSLIEEAFLMAEKAHEGQTREWGEAYMVHPLSIAVILSELRLDKESIAAALLYDLTERDYTQQELMLRFGEEIASLVQGVARLSRLPYTTDKAESQAENFRKMFLAMARDIRVILIKLADQLYCMRTLKYQSVKRQKEVSRETLDIYAPIAQRLGISTISMALEDLALKYLEPEIYYDLAKRVELTKTQRQQFIDQMIGKIQTQLERSGVDAAVSGRFKHFFSIYRKMVNRNKTLDEMYDLFAIRIIVNTIKECYAVLGMIHELYKPIPGRFKDYISMPKSNMYRSLHTTVLDTNGQSFEIQIRTREMHRTAEYGIAAHWKYKEGKTEGLILNKEEEKLNWLKQVLEWQTEMSDNREFMNLVKNDFDLMSEKIYCFTPLGDVKDLPRGASVIDFAYSIHSAVGNKMVGARVNGELVPLDYTVQNGDRIEILTSQNSPGPSKDWLGLVKSAQARNRINQWFREAGREENKKKGLGMLLEYCAAGGISPQILDREDYRERVLRKYSYHDWDLVLAAVGHGALTESQVINRILSAETAARSSERPEDNGSEPRGRRDGYVKNVIVGDGTRDYYIRFSKCCTPVPGDEIIGFITKGRGVTIHRTDCINMIKLPVTERGRLLDAEWNPDVPAEGYLTEIQILARNRIGMLADISAVLSGAGMDIAAMDCKIQKRGAAVLNVAFEVANKSALEALITRLKEISGVIDIQRANG